MRRDAHKAQDYARRHNVPKWYSDANKLINDADVNAIYIATPPSSHEEYTMMAFDAGKPVYVEKPMSVDAASASRMVKAAKDPQIVQKVKHLNVEPLGVPPEEMTRMVAKEAAVFGPLLKAKNIKLD